MFNNPTIFDNCSTAVPQLTLQLRFKATENLVQEPRGGPHDAPLPRCWKYDEKNLTMEHHTVSKLLWFEFWPEYTEKMRRAERKLRSFFRQRKWRCLRRRDAGICTNYHRKNFSNSLWVSPLLSKSKKKQYDYIEPKCEYYLVHW